MAPLRGFRDDDGSLQWGSIARHLRSVLFVWRCRAENRLRDGYAVLRGACNASTWDPEIADYCSGYSHWRCGKRRGHNFNGVPTEHRFNNYIWQGPGSVVRYDPLPIRSYDGSDWFDTRTVVPFSRLSKRRAIDRRGRSRLRARRAQEKLLQYRAYQRSDQSARLAGAIESAFRRHGTDRTGMREYGSDSVPNLPDQHPEIPPES